MTRLGYYIGQCHLRRRHRPGGGRAQRPRLLGHQRRRQPPDRPVDMAAQLGRDRPKHPRLRAAAPRSPRSTSSATWWRRTTTATPRGAAAVGAPSAAASCSAAATTPGSSAARWSTTPTGISVHPQSGRAPLDLVGQRVVGNVVEGRPGRPGPGRPGRQRRLASRPARPGPRSRWGCRPSSCTGLRLPLRMDLSTTLASLGQVAEANTGAYPVNRPEDQPAPPHQEQLPGGRGAVAPGRRRVRRLRVDLAKVPLPGPSDRPATVRKEPTVFGVPILATSPWQLVFALYGYLLPFVLHRLDLPGPVGPGPPRRPRPRGGHRLDRGRAAGAVRQRATTSSAGPCCRPGCRRRWSARPGRLPGADARHRRPPGRDRLTRREPGPVRYGCGRRGWCAAPGGGRGARRWPGTRPPP